MLDDCKPLQLSTKDDVKASKQQINLRRRDPAHALFEKRPIESDDL